MHDTLWGCTVHCKVLRNKQCKKVSNLQYFKSCILGVVALWGDCIRDMYFQRSGVLNSDSKLMVLLIYSCATIFGNCLAMCMLIFHKTMVQTVILSCLTGLNLDCFKSYGLKCRLRPCASSADSQKIASHKWPPYDHIWPSFCQLHECFHKTEFQTVILRCLMSLNLNWYQWL